MKSQVHNHHFLMSSNYVYVFFLRGQLLEGGQTNFYFEGSLPPKGGGGFLEGGG